MLFCCLSMLMVNGLEPVVIRQWVVYDKIVTNPLWINMMAELCKTLFTVVCWGWLNQARVIENLASFTIVLSSKSTMGWIVATSLIKVCADCCEFIGLYNVTSSVLVSIFSVAGLVTSAILQSGLLRQVPSLAEATTLSQLSICAIAWSWSGSADNSSMGTWSDGNTWLLVSMILSGVHGVIIQKCIVDQKRPNTADVSPTVLLADSMVVLQLATMVVSILAWVVLTPTKDWPIEWHGWTANGWSNLIIAFLAMVMLRGVAALVSTQYVSPIARVLCSMLSIVVTVVAEFLVVGTKWSVLQYLILLLFSFTGVQYAILATS